MRRVQKGRVVSEPPRAHSTQRMSAHQLEVLGHLGDAWKSRPDLSFTEFLEHSVRSVDADTLAMLGFSRIGNARLIEIARHFAMLGEIPTRPGKEPR